MLEDGAAILKISPLSFASFEDEATITAPTHPPDFNWPSRDQLSVIQFEPCVPKQENNLFF